MAPSRRRVRLRLEPLEARRLLTVTPLAANTPSVTDAITSEDVQTANGLIFARHGLDGAEVSFLKITSINGGTLYSSDGVTPISNGNFIAFDEGVNGLKFTPDADAFSPGSFVAQASVSNNDSGLGGDPVTAAITVTAVNDPPIAGDDLLSNFAQDSGTQTISISSLLINDVTGPANEIDQTLTLLSVNSPIGGTVSISGSNILFTPTAHFTGPASFQYTVQDNGQTNDVDDFLSSTANVNFTLYETNSPPLGGNDLLTSMAEDSTARTISFASLLANDAAGPSYESNQTLSIISVGSEVGGIASFSGSNILFTPDANFNGVASFVYTIQDDGTTDGFFAPQTADVTVTLTVTEVNDSPVGASNQISDLSEDGGTYNIGFSNLLSDDSPGPTDESNQQLTIVAVGNPSGGTVSISGTQVVFTPTLDYHGPAGFIYTLRDNGTTDGVSDPKTSTATVTFSINEVNDPPTGGDDTLSSLAEDNGTRIISFASLLGNDSVGPANESNQSLTIVGVNSAIGGTVSISGTNVRFTPNANFNGAASFSYVLQDDGTSFGVSDPQTSSAVVSFVITSVNDSPLGVNDALSSVSEDSSRRTIGFASLLGNDSAGPSNESTQSLTIIDVSNPVGGTVSISGTNVLFTPTANYNGPASFVYTLQDNGQSNGTNDFQSAFATASFTISEVNDAPTANPDSLSPSTDASPRTICFASLLSNDSAGPANESNQTLTITGVGNPIGGAVSISGSNVIFTPTGGFSGQASFNYTIQDNGTTAGSNDFHTAQGSASFTAAAVNSAPLNSLPAPIVTSEDLATAINGVSISDSDAGSATISVTLSVAHGSLTLNTGVSGGLTAAQITGNSSASVRISAPLLAINNTLANTTGLVYQGTLNYTGSDQLTVISNDLGNSGNGGAQTDTDSVSITLNLQDATPHITRINGTTAQVAGTSRADNFTITFSSVTGYSVIANGQSIAASNFTDITTLLFDGRGANDTLVVNSAAGVTESVTLQPNGLLLDGPTVHLQASSFESITAVGQSEDSATFTGSSGVDLLYGFPDHEQIQTNGTNHFLNGFGSFSAQSGGGIDTAILSGSSGNDTFSGGPTTCTLGGTGYQLQTTGYAAVYAFAGSGGTDTATLNDSSSDDIFGCIKEFASLQRPGSYFYQALFFNQYTAAPTLGGNDLAFVFDSSGDDTFTGSPTLARIQGPGYNTTLNNFDRVFSFHAFGGNDTVQLNGSSGDDTFTGLPQFSVLSGPNYFLQVGAYATVNADASQGGVDTALLYGSGGNDTFTARPTNSALVGQNYALQAASFRNVYADASQGGTDTATLFDSTGDDTFNGLVGFSSLSGATFFYQATSFGSVTAASSTGGNDLALFYDSPSSDTVTIGGSQARIQFANNQVLVSSYARVVATKTNAGSDRVVRSAINYNFATVGNWL